MRTRSRSEKDNYLFLGSITSKVPAKEEKASKEHEAGTRRQQITLIFKIVMAITPGETFQLHSRVLLSSGANCAKDIFVRVITFVRNLITFVFFFYARFIIFFIEPLI